MTYYAHDQSQYIGDVASIAGWDAFTSWARAQGGELQMLADNGISENTDQLVKQLESAKKPTDADVESIRANLLVLARKAVGVLVITE